MPKAGELIRASDTIRVAGVQESADSSATSGTTELVVGTITFSAIIGNIYETHWNLKTIQTVAGDRFLFSVREDSLTGAGVDSWIMNAPPGGGVGWMQMYAIDWTASATGSKTLVCTLQRSSGTGTITRASKSSYQVYRES